MNVDFLAHNMPVSDFASATGKKLATVADWRKRGMIDNYGQPHPNRDGTWIYSQEDVRNIYLASLYVENGIKWKDALWIAFVVGGYLSGQALYGSTATGYDVRFVLFYRSKEERNKQLSFRTGLDVKGPMDEAFNWNEAAICQLVDLNWTTGNLPARFLNQMYPRKVQAD